MLISASSVGETRAFGARVASQARAGDVYALDGDLGTGKTEFVRGFADALDPGIVVRSPSFSIVNTYVAPQFSIYHFDFYRLLDASELGEIGFDEYIAGNGVCLIEWGTMFASALPSHTRIITFRDIGTYEREIQVNFDFMARL